MIYVTSPALCLGSVPIRKSHRTYWLIAGIVLLATGIWLGHEPIASIGSPESLEARRTKLASQLSAVLEAEDRLVQDSLALRKLPSGQFVDTRYLFLRQLVAMVFPTASGLPGAVDDPITDMSPWRPIPASPNSTTRALGPRFIFGNPLQCCDRARGPAI